MEVGKSNIFKVLDGTIQFIIPVYQRADYVAFMRKVMPIDIEEAADGIILHRHKKGCTCVHPEFIQKCGSNLCECTKAHEEYAWSAFFGKPVKVKILESFLRGGKDCVIKLLI